MYSSFVQLAPLYPQIRWVLNRIPTQLNDPVSGNLIWLNYYEAIPWFLKGVLAGEFSTSNEFVIVIPDLIGLFTIPTNFYYAGLLYSNPLAKLTAIFDDNFGEFALQDINLALQVAPTFQVFASFASWTYFPGNLSMIGKWEIGNQISVNEPKEDFDILLTNTTLATNILNLVPLWTKIVLDTQASTLRPREALILSKLNNEKLVDLSRISPVVSTRASEKVLNLKAQYFDNLNEVNPTIFCQSFLTNVLEEIFPIFNGCLDSTRLIESNQLHPNIRLVNL